MIFDSPQWSIRPDPRNRPEVQCNLVSNVLDIVDNDAVSDITIMVPSSLYPLLRYLGIERENGVVQLFVQREEGRWHLGFDQGEGTTLYMLWYYTDSNLPRCIQNVL